MDFGKFSIYFTKLFADLFLVVEIENLIPFAHFLIKVALDSPIIMKILFPV
jgi:hypothetical protein